MSVYERWQWRKSDRPGYTHMADVYTHNGVVCDPRDFQDEDPDYDVFTCYFNEGDEETSGMSDVDFQGDRKHFYIDWESETLEAI